MLQNHVSEQELVDYLQSGKLIVHGHELTTEDLELSICRNQQLGNRCWIVYETKQASIFPSTRYTPVNVMIPCSVW